MTLSCSGLGVFAGWAWWIASALALPTVPPRRSCGVVHPKLRAVLLSDLFDVHDRGTDARLGARTPSAQPRHVLLLLLRRRRRGPRDVGSREAARRERTAVDAVRACRRRASRLCPTGAWYSQPDACLPIRRRLTARYNTDRPHQALGMKVRETSTRAQPARIAACRSSPIPSMTRPSC